MKTTYILILFLIIGSITACKKMDGTYKQYIVQGGKTYTGKAIDPVARPGRNRVEISWLRGSDPNVTKAVISWNNYADSVEVNVSSGNDTISTIIDNLPERSYSFMIKTYDAEGNSSVPAEIQCTVFGEEYQAALLSRPVISNVVIDSNQALSIQWGNADISSGAFATEVKYTDTLGETQMRRFDVTESNSVISDYNPGTAYQYRTLYLPDSIAIDTFYTDYVTQHVSWKIDKTGWIATADSYEATAALPNGPPSNAIDDNVNTFWHTDYSVAPQPGYPHWLAVDLNRTIVLTKIELTSRSDYFKEDFTNFILQGSMDGQTWTDYGTYTMPDATGPQSFDVSTAPTVKYIRIYMTAGPYFFTHLAEFSVFGY